jgi:hypothetical protein
MAGVVEAAKAANCSPRGQLRGRQGGTQSFRHWRAKGL